jgi:Bifunctional DNA primase/polymerase, N-terminal
MAFLGVSVSTRRIFGAAKTYLYQNYNIIPIWGELKPERAKVASVDWKVYQNRRVKQLDLENWLAQEKFGGLAIITGKISRLIVLDFDDEVLAKEFARRYPHLTKTRTVLSAGRNLPHYYYHIPLNATVESRHAKGVDLQAEGRYVIAAPTMIDDKEYKILRGGQPCTLTNAQISLILRFVDEQRLFIHESPEKALIPPDMPVQEIILPRDAITIYQHYAPDIGRNEALFRTSCRLRDVGWLREDVIRCLAMIHAQEPPSGQHRRESRQERLREAQATINSVFSKAPRKIHKTDSDSPQTLPNSIREHLLQQKQTALVRVLDGLLMKDVTQGVIVTEREICELLKGHVGRFSVLKALAATYENGNPIFIANESEIPSPKPPSHTIVATAKAGNTNNKCLLFRTTKANKNQRGRPAKTYFVPRIEILCSQFGVKFTQSDPICKEDLRSSKTYRQALHRELIKRRPGLYPRKWLAKRLGITKRTSQRYQLEDVVKYKAMYFQQDISWDNLGQISDMPDIMGVFLQDESGKRYPPKRELAKKLLADGHSLTYMRQDVNYYWHPAMPPSPLVAMGIHPNSPEKSENSRKYSARSSISISTPSPVSLRPPQSIGEGNEESRQSIFHSLTTQSPREPEHKEIVQERYVSHVSEKSQKIVSKSKRYYRQNLPDALQENTAQRLYRKIRSRYAEKTGYLSMAVTRRLTEQYGTAQVRRLIQVLSWRDDIENPAGFSVVWLRSEAKRAGLEQMMM